MDDDAVFKALADPTRRHLLDRLYERDGRTLTELESELEMTRFGVMKHLRVLEDAGLVVTRRAGREKQHFLNPVPIRLDRQVHRAPRRGAQRPQETIGGVSMTTMTAQTTQVYQVFIGATPEQIWEAITTPEFTTKYFHGSAVESTLEPGSPWNGFSADHSEHWVDGEVLEAEAPRRLQHTWRALYDPETAVEPHSRVTWEIEPQENGTTLLTVVHDRLEDSPKTAANVSGTGWMHVLSGLKTLLETGQPLGS